MKGANHPTVAPIESIRITPQVARPEVPLATPSKFHFIQPQLGGRHTNSTIKGPFSDPHRILNY